MTCKNLIYSLFLFAITTAYSQPKDTIYGKVKSVREQINFFDENRQNAKLFVDDGDYGHNGFMGPKRTKAQFNNWWYHTAMVHYVNYYKEFNEKGQPTYETWFNKNGDTIRTYLYRYNREEQLIEVKKKYKDNEYSVDQYHYDSKGRKQTEIYYTTDTPFYYGFSEYLYNDQDQLVVERNFDKNGDSGAIKYTYDSKGRITQKIYHRPSVYVKMPDGVTSSKRDSIGIYQILEEYIYNDTLDLTESIFYDQDFDNKFRGSILHRESVEYENGLQKRKRFFVGDKFANIKSYEYDQYGRLIREERTSPRFPRGNTLSEYSYDNDGNLIKLVYTEDKQTVTATFEYEFDTQNNWVKQVKSLDGEKLFAWTRKIEYY